MNNEKNILAIRIKDLRRDMKLTQEELAKKLGLNNKSSIANYESGYSVPSDDIKLKMCEVFNCSMDYLMGKTEYKSTDEMIDVFFKTQYEIDVHNAIINSELLFLNTGLDPEQIKQANNVIQNVLLDETSNETKGNELIDFINSFSGKQKNELKKIIENILTYIDNQEKYRSIYSNLINIKINEKNKYYMCPVYGQISAGQPNWAEENIEGTLPIDPNLMDIVNPEECFFLRVNGESMNKVVRNGAFALIRKQDMVENGEIAVVLVNGYDATLKKFTKQGDLVILEPQSNDESFKTQVYDKNTPIQILGKYIGKMEFNK